MNKIIDETRIRLVNKGMFDPDTFELYIFTKSGPVNSPRISVAEPVLMVDHGEAFADPPPVARFRTDTVQMLYDELTNAGFRPSRGTEPTQAVQAHLKDLRTVLFHKLGIKDE